jgi:hypothetical protein
MSDNSWDYFTKDAKYSSVLRDRLTAGVEMDSAKALGGYLERTCDGDLRVLDFGGGPGHYYPVLRRCYTKGALRYLSVDIDVANIRFGAEYFEDDSAVELRLGSVLDPEPSVPADINCIISANTLPHVPTIEPLLKLLSTRDTTRWFIFRMLVGSECVQIKKHLREHDFDQMFERDYQHNNIYSRPYLEHHLGPRWDLSIEDDVFDPARLEHHRLPAQDTDAFYGNRVSRSVGSLVFKGEIYMPWKFVIGRRR